MELDHATIVTNDVDALRQFFCVVAGLSEGPRPAFGFNGSWLYADDGRPLIHLIESPVSETEGSTPSPRIDHVALRVESPEEWAALLERMRQNRVVFQRAQVPATGELQLFVSLAPGVTIEFVTRPSNMTNL
jgi:catechol 2,3-dioxygenase-like lactoylglutathione lyase family enzyme